MLKSYNNVYFQESLLGYSNESIFYKMKTRLWKIGAYYFDDVRVI